MNTLALRERKASLRLTARQEKILEGMLLGDGHLERQRGALSARLKIEHSAAQATYVAWKYIEWRDWVRTPPKEKLKKNRLGTTSVNVGFSTLSHRELEAVRQRFYPDGRKIVPEDLELNSLNVAVWFMDDGSKKSSQCRGIYFNTQSYTVEEVELLQRLLRRDVGVETSVRQQRDGLQIYVPSPSVTGLLSFISAYVLPCMRYKLPG